MELIDPAASKIPLWILCGIRGKAQWEKGKLVPGTTQFFFFGFYLNPEYCEMAKECLEHEYRFRDTKIWIQKTEANHMWVWDITEGP